MTLDEVDLARDHLSVAGQLQPLGELTRAAMLAYLAERRNRWPHTANGNVFVSKQTANGTAPVSTFYIKRHLTLRGISLEHIRRDRCPNEALANGADSAYTPLRPCGTPSGLAASSTTRSPKLAAHESASWRSAGL